jgi:O-antigen/teichoic acid export membrane protein
VPLGELVMFSKIIIRNSAYGFIAQIAIKILSFLFSIYIIRDFGAGTYGQYTAILAFGAVFAIISDLGLSPYTVREVARLRNSDDGLQKIQVLTSNVIILRLVLTIIASLTMTAAALLTSRPIIMVGAIAFSSLGLFVYSVGGTYEAVLAGYERFDLISGAKVANQLFFVFLGACIILLGFGYYGLIAANIVGTVLMTYIYWRGIRQIQIPLIRINYRLWLTLLRTSLPFGLIGFALGLSYKFDTILLNIYRGDVETGLYNAAYNLVFSSVVLSNVINTALYPSLTRRVSASPSDLPRLFESFLRYLLLLALPIAIGIWSIADKVVTFLYSNAYASSTQVLQIIIWVIPLMYLSEYLGYIVIIENKESRVARAIIVSTTFNISINLILVPRYGYVAAAIMTVLTEGILVLQHLWTLRGLVNRINLAYVVFRPILAAALMGVLVISLKPYLPLFVTISVGAATYIILLFIFRAIKKEEIDLVFNLILRRKAVTSL